MEWESIVTHNEVGDVLLFGSGISNEQLRSQASEGSILKVSAQITVQEELTVRVAAVVADVSPDKLVVCIHEGQHVEAEQSLVVVYK